MGKSKIPILLSLLIVLLYSMPVSTSGEEDGCSCFSQVSLTILDDNCKNFCQEYLGLGSCIGWEQLDTHCVSGSFCIMKWRVFCADGSSRDYTTWDYCPAYPLYNPPNSTEEPDSKIKKPNTTKPVKPQALASATITTNITIENPEETHEDNAKE